METLPPSSPNNNESCRTELSKVRKRIADASALGENSYRSDDPLSTAVETYLTTAGYRVHRRYLLNGNGLASTICEVEVTWTPRRDLAPKPRRGLWARFKRWIKARLEP